MSLCPLPLSFSVADEETLDERAKLSVAAKRSLFRVSFNQLSSVCPLISTDTKHGDMCYWSWTQTLTLYFLPSLLWGFRDENLEILMIWFQRRHSTGTSCCANSIYFSSQLSHQTHCHFQCKHSLVRVCEAQVSTVFHFKTLNNQALLPDYPTRVKVRWNIPLI